MKIDIIGPSYPYRGGISHHTTMLFKHLKERNQVKFYSFKRQYPRFLFPGKTDRDLSNLALKDDECLPLLDSLNPWTWITVARRIIQDHPKLTLIPWWIVFWAPQFLTIICILKIFSRTKILFICHNVIEHESNIIKVFVSKLTLGRGDYFIVQSTEERENLVKLIGERAIKKVFHPQLDVFNPRQIPKEKAKRSIGIDDEKVILFFGFVRKYKGLKYLLEAMPQILEDIDVRLLVAGEFWDDKDQYLRIIRDLKLEESVTIIDKYIANENILYYFYAADIVVLPYVTVTGSGLAQLAFSFNKPVIVTRVGAFPELVIDKKTGFLVSPRNSFQIARAVKKFYQNYDESEFSKNIESEKSRYSWESTLGVIESFE